MPKTKAYNLTTRMRIAAKLEIVLQAQLAPLKNRSQVEVVCRIQQVNLRLARKIVIRRLIVDDWPEHKNDQLLNEYLADINARISGVQVKSKIPLCLSYHYLATFITDSCPPNVQAILKAAEKRYQEEYGFSIDDDEDMDDDEEDSMMEYIHRQMNRPD